MSDINVTHLAVELSELYHLAKNVLPTIAEEFAKARNTVSGADGTDEFKFQHANGEVSIVAGPLAEITAVLQAALAANHERLNESADSLKQIYIAYRETDRLSAHELSELEARLYGKSGYDSQITEMAIDGGYSEPVEVDEPEPDSSTEDDTHPDRNVPAQAMPETFQPD